MRAIRRLALPVGLLGLLLPASCGSQGPVVRGASGAGADRQVPQAPSAPPAGPQATVNGSDPRAQAAGAAITDIIGHPLAFTIDAALAEREGPQMQDALIGAMEAAVDGLRGAARRQSDAFAYVVPLLKTIAFAYSPGSEVAPPSFDPASGTMTLHVPPRASNLLEPGDLPDAINGAFEAATTARFANREPETIAPSEQSAYYHFLAGGRAHTGDAKDRASDHLLRLSRLLRLYDRIADAGLRAELRHRLATFASNLWSLHDQADPPTWAAVRDLYVRWANARIGELDTSEMRALATGMFNEARDTTHAMIQGFDAIRFAGPALDALASEPEEHITLQGDTATIVDVVLCPSRRDRDRLSVHSCVGAFYTSVFAQPDGAARLARVVSTAQNPRVADTIAINLMTHVSTPAALALVDALDDASAPMALRGLAEYGGWDSRYPTNGRALGPDPGALVAWIRATWKSRPALRGALLYALTQVDGARQGTVPWGKLSAFLGGAVGSAEFDAFLGQGRRAFWSVDTIAQGLSTGWSRSRVIVPRFEQWLGDLATYDDGGPYRQAISERIVTAICSGRDYGDVSAFQAFVRSRVESFPREKGQYGDVPASSAAALCKVSVAAGDSSAVAMRPVPAPAEPPEPVHPSPRPAPYPQPPVPQPATPQRPPAAPRPQNPAAVPVLFGDD